VNLLVFLGCLLITERQQIPAFSLYGDPTAFLVPRFVHAERITTRARIHDWRIGTHRHPDLCQALIVTSGGGAIEVEGEVSRFAAPWLLWLPAAVVHGFHFDASAEGFVVTVSTDFLGATISGENAAELSGTAERFISEPIPPAVGELDLPRSFEAILRAGSLIEFGSRLIVEAHLKLILVGLARIWAIRHAEAPLGQLRSSLFRRFRHLVDQHFRAHWGVARYAEATGISEDRLHAICTQAADKPPQTLIHDRLMLEAKRGLLYTSMTVSEIGFDLGFKDPAYFCRFFAKRAGAPPSRFRREHR